LSERVIAKINNFRPDFRKWLETDECKSFLRERDERKNVFRNLLSKDVVEQLSEPDFRRIIASLWAYAGWTNKDYVADRVLKSTDFNTLRSELKKLLYGHDPLAERYDRFFEIVRGIGPAGITEILAFVDPSQYGIWNDKSRKALDILGLGEVLPTKKYRINGSEYEEVVEALKSIFKLIEPGKTELDLLYVDLFLLFIATKEMKKEEVVIEEEDYDFDHDEIVEKLVELGSGLGFEASSEVQVARGARVDVLWQAKIANLGVVSYVFEVQRGGSIDSLILNLQRAKNNPTVQKLVVVANTKDLKKIKDEVESLSEEFRKSTAYMEAKDVLRATELLSELNKIISKLELVKSF